MVRWYGQGSVVRWFDGTKGSVVRSGFRGSMVPWYEGFGGTVRVPWKITFPVVQNSSSGNGTAPVPSSINFWYSLEHDFMDAVQPNKFSVDYIKELYDMIVIGKNFTVAEVGTILERPEITGVLALFVIGILYSAGMVFGGLAFCFYQCCSTSYQKHREDGAKPSRYTMSAFLVLFVCLISFGTGMLGASLTDVIRTTDSLPTFVNTTFASVNNVLEETESQIEVIVRDGFKSVTDAILSDLQNADQDLSRNIYGTLNRSVNEIINGIDRVDDDASKIGSGLRALNAGLITMNSLLNTSRTTFESILTRWNTACDTAGPQFCSGLQADKNMKAIQLPDIFSLGFNLAPILSGLDEIERANLSLLAENARTSYGRISVEIKENIPAAELKLNEAFNEVHGWINDSMSSLRDGVAYIEDVIEPVQREAHTFASLPRDYQQYITGIVIGVSTFFGVLAGVVLLCTCIGAAAYRADVLPTRRRGLETVGGCGLYTVVYVTLVFSWLFMLITTALFLIASQADSVICPILDGEADNYTALQQLSDLFLPKNATSEQLGISGDSIPEFSQVLLACKGGATFYTSFRLDEHFALDQLGNVINDAEIHTHLGELGLTNEDVTIFSNNSEAEIRKFMDHLQAIDLGKLTADLAKHAQGSYLKAVEDAAKSVEDLAASASTSVAAQFNGIVNDLRALSNNSLNSFDGERKRLFDSLPMLVQDVNYTMKSANQTLIKGLEVHKILLEAIRKAVSEYADSQAAHGKDYVVYVVREIRQDLGQCKPVYDVYDAAVTLLCRDALPALNGIWFALGLILLTLLPTIIVGGCLAKHYRRAKTTDVVYLNKIVQDSPVLRMESRYT
ncbi:putative Prominin-1 [Hypsibius exemplaris]|uniref:Prominin-1 n=1 Tax=Hypsibius exemplaris TaxID=2072580 RepID=A0A9X6NKA0_HYPEX|nr:putative Prominin-1 [Hypsibius exemplaris]